MLVLNGGKEGGLAGCPLQERRRALLNSQLAWCPVVR